MEGENLENHSTVCHRIDADSPEFPRIPSNAPEFPRPSQANSPRIPPGSEQLCGLWRLILWFLAGIYGVRSVCHGASHTIRGEQRWALARTEPQEAQGRL